MELDLELQRLRDWRHDKIDPFIISTEWRLRQIEKELKDMGPRLDSLARADEIADAVQKRMNGAQRVRFTRWQIVGGLIVAGAAAADMISSLLRHG